MSEQILPHDVDISGVDVSGVRYPECQEISATIGSVVQGIVVLGSPR